MPILLTRRAELELAMQRVDDARADAARAIALKQPTVSPGQPSSYLGRANLALGRALIAAGRDEDARGAFASALEQLRPTLGPDHPQTRLAERLASTPTAGPGRK